MPRPDVYNKNHTSAWELYAEELEAELAEYEYPLRTKESVTVPVEVWDAREQQLEAAKDERAVVDRALHERRVELAKLRELLTLIRDDLRMRSEDGVVDISVIWMRIDKVLQGERGMKANDTRAKGMVFNQKAGEYIQELEAEKAKLREQIQALEMEVKGRNPDGTIIPATPFHQ